MLSTEPFLVFSCLNFILPQTLLSISLLSWDLNVDVFSFPLCSLHAHVVDFLLPSTLLTC
uniref:Uncharacterized protein n=1 Tax=Arundo donax TaxID=35708 RepID=A0A0A8XUD2_ARUDO